MEVVRTEIEPRLIGQNALRRRALLGARLSRSPSTSCAIAASASSRSRASTRRSGTRSARRSAGRSYELWGGYRDRLPVNIIGGYYGPADEIRGEVEEWLEMGFRGCKFKLGSRPPAEDAARVRVVPRGGRRRLRDHDRREPGLHAADGARPLRARARISDIRWFEEPCRWANDARDMRDVRLARRHPRVRRPERVLPRGLPRPDGGRRDRRLQLRRVLGGRPDELAPQRRRRAHVLGASSRTTRSRTSRPTCSRASPHGTYLEVFHPDRDPIWWSMIANRPDARGRRDAAARTARASAGSSTTRSSSATAPTADAGHSPSGAEGVR